MFESLRDYFHRPDVLITYARQDGSAYAEALASALLKRGYSCFIDHWVQSPASLQHISRMIRRCRAIVVVGSAAATTSQSLTHEIALFLNQQKLKPLIPIEFDVPLSNALWWPMIVGRPIAHETLEALAAAAPSKQIIERIQASLDFVSRDTKLKRAVWATSIAILALMFTSLFSVTLLARQAASGELSRPNVLSWILIAAAFGGGVFVGIFFQRLANTKRSAKAENRAFRIEQAGAAGYLQPFISYCHTDKPFAKQLEIALDSRGVNCWIDEKSLRAGDDVPEAIAKGIEDFDRFILCCSKASLKSWWVDNELGTAFQKEEAVNRKEGRSLKMVIPLDLDGSLFKDDWKSGYKAQLKRRLAVDFTDWKNQEEFQTKVGELMLALVQDNRDRQPPSHN
jgi:hypothetical protein